MAGDYQQDANGTLAVYATGNHQSSALSVTGAASLAGDWG
jgi:hypothetical protein